VVPQLYTHLTYCSSLVDLIVEDHRCQFQLGSWNIFINNDTSLQSRKMIDDWLVFNIGWTALAIMVKRWAKGWALRGTLQLMQDKDDILFRVGRTTKKHNKQLMNMTICTHSQQADVWVVTWLFPNNHRTTCRKNKGIITKHSLK
jgi:hypothetical protein